MNSHLIICTGTDRAVALAIHRCVGLLTEHHSVTSRRHSLSTLLRAELDVPFTRAVTTYRERWDVSLLNGFLPSLAWLRAPSDSKPIATANRNNADIANERAERWRARLRGAIRSAQASTRHPHRPACVAFCSTLDSAMALISKFSSLLPAHTHGDIGRVALKVKGRAEPYCELCWRPTEFATHGELRDAEDQRQQISRRFCSEHNQQRSPSSYRRDLKFKERFTAECERLTWQNLRRHKHPFAFLPEAECTSGWQMHLVPVSGHEEDIRRAAYAMVHSGLRGTQAQCLALQAQGCDMRKIAERLAVTERAVRFALSAAQPRLESAERIRWGSRSAPL